MRALALALALIPTSGVADCLSERDLLFDALDRNGWTVSNSGSFGQVGRDCRVRGLSLSERSVEIDVGLLEWRLDGLNRLALGNGEITLEGRIEDLRVVPSVEDPWIGYMLAEQNRRSLIDVDLEAEWSLDEGRLELTGLNVDLPGDNAFRLAFRVFGVTPALIEGRVSDLAQLSVETIGISAQNNGFFDGLILGALVGQMSGVPGTPQTVIDATKGEAVNVLNAFPETLFMDGSKQALSTLLADAPVPWGEIDVSLTAAPPLPVSRFLLLAPNPLSPEALSVVLDGARVFVKYEPTPEQE